MDHELIDIHTHIVYGIDDGAPNYEESLRLIGMEYDQGVRGMFWVTKRNGDSAYPEGYN